MKAMTYNEAINFLRVEGNIELEEIFTKEMIQKVRRHLATKFHPDIKNGSEEKMKLVNEACDTIIETLDSKKTDNSIKKEDEKTKKKYNHNIDPYKSEVEILAKKLDINYKEVEMRYYSHLRNTNSNINIKEYIEIYIHKYYKDKEIIIKMFKQFQELNGQEYNGGLMSIIDIYEENCKSNISIIEWLETLIKAKELSITLGITPNKLHAMYDIDKTLGYSDEYVKYIGRMHSALELVPDNDNTLKKLLNEYINENIDKQFIEYFEYKMLEAKYKTDGEGLIFRLFNTVKQEDESISLFEYICSLMGEYDNTKEDSDKKYKKTKF